MIASITRIAVLVSAVMLVASRSLAQQIERVEIKGAHALITVPNDWNGGLFLYAHGYTGDTRIVGPIPDDFTQADPVLWPGMLNFLPPGYASAITTFRSAGWDVKDAIKDVENLRRYFVKKYGAPKYTYVWGHSEGGMIAATLVEYFPRTYDGAVPMCGTGAGARRLFNGMYDLRVLFEYACRDVPEARFVCGLCSDGESRCIDDADCPAAQTCETTEAAPPPEDGLTRDCTAFVLGHPERFARPTGLAPLVGRAVTACFGNMTRTPEQAARRDLVVRASQLPDDQLESTLYFASVGLAEVVHRRTGGKHPWSNVGVEYASPLLSNAERAALNAGVHRSASDPDAVRWVRRFYEPRGRTRARIITVHALDDGLVIPEHEEKYHQAFEASGRAEQLVQFFTPTGKHCANAVAFTPALQQMVGWVERGERPTAESMNSACGGCLVSTFPAAFGGKVPERRQKGAPLRKMVCAGHPGDCPGGSTCSTATHRCE